jgi:hypothetical protein
MLKVISHGIFDAIDATTAPIPRLTKVMGIAQQIRVPDVVNSRTQLQVRGFFKTARGVSMFNSIFPVISRRNQRQR